MHTYDFCDTCEKEIEGEMDEYGDYWSEGFDCRGGEHSYCSDECYLKSGCHKFFDCCYNCGKEYFDPVYDCNIHGMSCSSSCAAKLDCGENCDWAR